MEEEATKLGEGRKALGDLTLSGPDQGVPAE